jgi:hypothetical protein
MWATRATGYCRIQCHRVVIDKATRDWPVSHVLRVVHPWGPDLRLHIFSGRVIRDVWNWSFVGLVRNPTLGVWMRNLRMASSRIYGLAHHLIILLLKVPLVLTLVHWTSSGLMGYHKLLLLNLLILLELLELLELKELLVLVIWNERILLPIVCHSRATLNFDPWLLLLLKLSLGLGKLLCLS